MIIVKPFSKTIMFESQKILEEEICPVCGSESLDDIPYRIFSISSGGNSEICSCCSFQFGYSEFEEVPELDYSYFMPTMFEAAFQVYLMRWIKEGPINYAAGNKMSNTALDTRLRNLDLDRSHLLCEQYGCGETIRL